MAEVIQVCAFCHTPESPSDLTSVRGGTGFQPLWQHAIPADHTFIMFDDIGRGDGDGSMATGSQSIACLSCHDGNQALSITLRGNDHPFGVPYRGALDPARQEQARIAARMSGNPINEARLLKFGEDFRPAMRGLVDNKPAWWASRTGNPAMRSRDDLPLFVRRSEFDDSEVPFIECASCHDPHSSKPLFLRNSEGDGGICLTCHVK